MDTNVDVKELLGISWGIVKDNFSFFLKVLGLLIGYIILVSVIASLSLSSRFGLSVAALLVLPFAFGPFLAVPGFIKATIQMASGQKPEISVLWSAMNAVISTILAGILIGFLVAVGMIFLVIPGLYAAVVTSFFMYFIVDQQLGPIASLKASQQLVSGKLITLTKVYATFFILSFVCTFIPVLGQLLTLVLGLIQAVSMAILYQRWSGINQANESPQVPITPNPLSSEATQATEVTQTVPSVKNPPTPVTELGSVTPDPQEFRQMKQTTEVPELENITPSTPGANPLEDPTITAPQSLADVPPPSPKAMQPKIEPEN